MNPFRKKTYLYFLLITLLIGCQKQSVEKQELPIIPPLPQDNQIQVYFNHNQSANYHDEVLGGKRSGDDLEEAIITAINSANYTIDVAIQELNLPKISQALAQQHQAGVKVRVILENNYSRSFSEFSDQEINQLNQRDNLDYQEYFSLVDTNQDGKLSTAEINNGDALAILINANIPIIDDTADGSKGSGLMHHKFIVIDGVMVITGSANFTRSDIHGKLSFPDSLGNTNHLLTINDASLAQLFTDEFNQMWGDGPGGNLDSKFGVNKSDREPEKLVIGSTTVTVSFSPDSQGKSWDNTSNGLIGSTLQSANQSIDLALFVFTDQKIANILAISHQQGSEIRALIDANFAFRYYSEGLDMLGIARPKGTATRIASKCKYESENQPWQEPITTVGVPQLPIGDKLHHKFAVIDNKIVITGSHNWSAAANYQNDEALLIIENPTIAAHFEREFTRLYSTAVLGVPVGVQNKIQQQQQECSRQ